MQTSRRHGLAGTKTCGLQTKNFKSETTPECSWPLLLLAAPFAALWFYIRARSSQNSSTHTIALYMLKRFVKLTQKTQNLSATTLRRQRKKHNNKSDNELGRSVAIQLKGFAIVCATAKGPIKFDRCQFMSPHSPTAQRQARPQHAQCTQYINHIFIEHHWVKHIKTIRRSRPREPRAIAFISTKSKGNSNRQPIWCMIKCYWPRNNAHTRWFSSCVLDGPAAEFTQNQICIEMRKYGIVSWPMRQWIFCICGRQQPPTPFAESGFLLRRYYNYRFCAARTREVNDFDDRASSQLMCFIAVWKNGRAVRDGNRAMPCQLCLNRY